jgi:phosphohistidine phosphatase
LDVLILMRHGKAVRDDEAPSDRERGLTPRGRRDAKAAGEHLIEAGLMPGRILVSGAARTRQTFEALSERLPAPVDFVDRLYMASAGTIWNAAMETGDRAVMVIGHNPGIHELIATLTEQTHDRSPTANALGLHLPTAAYAAFSLSGSTRGAAGPRLLSSWSPKD